MDGRFLGHVLSFAGDAIYVLHFLHTDKIVVYRPASRVDFPQIVAGPETATSVLLRNESNSRIDGTQGFFAPDGKPLAMALQGRSAASTHPFTLQPQQELRLTTESTDQLAAGWAVARSLSLGLRGSATLVTGTTVRKEIAMLPSELSDRVSLPVRRKGTEETAVALVKPGSVRPDHAEVVRQGPGSDSGICRQRRQQDRALRLRVVPGRCAGWLPGPAEHRERFSRLDRGAADLRPQGCVGRPGLDSGAVRRNGILTRVEARPRRSLRARAGKAASPDGVSLGKYRGKGRSLMTRIRTLAAWMTCLATQLPPLPAQNLGDVRMAGIVPSRSSFHPGAELRPPYAFSHSVQLEDFRIGIPAHLLVIGERFLVPLLFEPGWNGGLETYTFFDESGAQLWQVAVPGGVPQSLPSSAAMPAAGADWALLPGGNLILAVRLQDGQELWRDESIGTVLKRHPMITGDLAIYNGAEKVVLRRRSGEIVWEQPVATRDAPLALWGGRLYALLADGRLMSVDFLTGASVGLRRSRSLMSVLVPWSLLRA